MELQRIFQISTMNKRIWTIIQGLDGDNTWIGFNEIRNKCHNDNVDMGKYAMLIYPQNSQNVHNIQKYV